MQDDSRQQRTPKTDERSIPLPVTFSQLAGGRTECAIEHEGQLYRLRVTKNGKLILNK
ncbi:MAG: hemin uptake protein HemP [Planctomycetaceae bacterium]|nr:hemin uptake protein HemP [Planctomycetaceae bacterium]